MATPFTTIKVRREVRDRLARIAQERTASMAEVLEIAVVELERESFFRQMHADLERLRENDPKDWTRYRAESRAWEDATIADGLGDTEEVFW